MHLFQISSISIHFNFNLLFPHNLLFIPISIHFNPFIIKLKYNLFYCQKQFIRLIFGAVHKIHRLLVQICNTDFWCCITKYTDFWVQCFLLSETIYNIDFSKGLLHNKYTDFWYSILYRHKRFVTLIFDY